MKFNDLLEPRSFEQLCERTKQLAATYTPEWRFDPNDPDIGSTLALIYNKQMADNIQRMSRLQEKYQTEFVNLLGISLLPAYPASGFVVANVISGSNNGVPLPRGTKLMSDSESDPLIFETTRDVFLTNAKLTDIVSISGSNGRIIPIKGGPTAVKIIPKNENIELSDTVEEEGAIKSTDIPPFTMFQYDEPGVEQNALLIYHTTVFDTQTGIPIMLLPTTSDGTSMANIFADTSRYEWSYFDGEKLATFSDVLVKNGCLFLQRESESQPVSGLDKPFHIICIKAITPVNSLVEIGDLRIASTCSSLAPEHITHNGEELSEEMFLPFGESASLFDECYIGDDRIFSQQDATITLSFRLTKMEKLVSFTPQQQQESLKIIKRKPRMEQTIAASCPQRVSLEYYNGTGWRKLSCSDKIAPLFDGNHSGIHTVTFACPVDWVPLPIDSYEGRSLRLRLVQADNCYMLPCLHTMPIIHDLKISYSYEDRWKQPQMLRTICGTKLEDQTTSLLEKRPITAFKQLSAPTGALYLGFNRPLSGSPISMLIDVEENTYFSARPISFHYSTRAGFKPIKVIDGTNNLTGAGTIMFMPPTDFAACEVEGQRCWWLRLSTDTLGGYHARVRSIQLNAVEIRNQETMREERFYIDVSSPNMSFNLSCENILCADVFVNERAQLSRSKMEEMLIETPNDVRVEYNFLGEITSFFVRWKEVENFDGSKSVDRHYLLNRMNNTIVFGDGVHVRIPQAHRDVAFTVRAICCNGELGNVPAGAINRFFNNIMYIESVVNPMPTYAGNNLESVDSARHRGANLLNSRNRLVSELDYVRAIKGFSASIKKIKCVAGVDIDGKSNTNLITIAIMTKEYKNGAYSFNNICEPLRQRLLERCAATVTEESLVISEPIYVELKVDVWVKIDDAAYAFDTQNLILESINNFLEPLGSKTHNPWDIGVLPNEAQIRMMLYSLRFQGRINRFIVVARYTDAQGIHEVDLEHLPKNPFAIGINGEHQIHSEF